MNANSYVRVKDVAKELDISEGMAYKIIRKLNKELKDQGYVTVRGRLSRRYFSRGQRSAWRRP